MNTKGVNKRAVIALGGNAISLPDVEDTITNQFQHTREALRGILDLVRNDYQLVITHGNGPQVGNALLRVEAAADRAPILPLGICVADTEGGMGYMIEQCLQNVMQYAGLHREVATLVTQMLVDQHDERLKNPTKFIGQRYSEEEAKRFEQTRGWVMKQDAKGAWRRVVGSPMPLGVIPGKTIKTLVERGTIVIAGGGGGVPVYEDEYGLYEGVDAVIDKDLASAVIAREIGADTLMILTGVEKVSINFNKPDQRDLDCLTLDEARKYLDEGQFPPGSMGPKIRAAIQFIEGGGKQAIITSFKLASEALLGVAGTRVIR